MGCRIDGCQAEFVRVPFGDMGLIKLPETVGDEEALFIGDILSTGYFGAELSEIKPGDTVAVIGAGPVGLCAAQCAKLFGAATIIVIDTNEFRLQIAEQNQLADITINPKGEKVEQRIHSLTWRGGADSVIEAAGGDNTFQMAWKIARPNAVVALIAMYEKSQELPLPEMYGKNLIFKTGGVDGRHCATLLELVEKKCLRTDFLITHRAPLKEIMTGYRVFGEKLDHCLKWVVTP